MCGIAGIVSFGDWRPSETIIEDLFTENMSRGRDATGIGYLDNTGNMKIRKSPQIATWFVSDLKKENLFPEILESPIIMMHTRFKTKGDEKRNENNHPVPYENWVVVHNGTVINDDEIFEHFKPATRYAEVDTEAIALVLHKQGVSGLGLLNGSSVICAWNKETPNKILLAKVGSGQLSVYFLGDLLVFSSNGPPLSVFPTYKLQEIKFHSLGNLLSIPRDTYLEIDTEKKMFSDKIVCTPIPLKMVSYPIPIETKNRSSTSNVKHILQEGYPPIDLSKIHDPSYYDRLAGSEIVEKLETVFGRWLLSHRADGTAKYTFHPRRSVRKWYARKKEFEWWHNSGGIPAPKSLLRIPSGGKFEARLHYICGFCGVCLYIRAWKYQKIELGDFWLCPFCEQASTVPSIEIC